MSSVVLAWDTGHRGGYKSRGTSCADGSRGHLVVCTGVSSSDAADDAASSSVGVYTLGMRSEYPETDPRETPTLLQLIAHQTVGQPWHRAWADDDRHRAPPSPPQKQQNHPTQAWRSGPARLWLSRQAFCHQ